MKNQYFADRRDFHKYDLLLHLMGCGPGFEQLLMAWWLTSDDESGDGGTRYYEVGARDKALHDWLEDYHDRLPRDVRRLADFPGIRDAEWTYSQVLDIVPDDPHERMRNVDRVVALASPPGLIFLDPDNGMMVKSATRASRCKYVDYSEVGHIAGAMCDDSLLIVFQFLPRVKRPIFYPAALELLRSRSGVQHVTWVSPDNVVAYFLVAKSESRLSDVRRRLLPYVTLNGFHFEGDRRP